MTRPDIIVIGGGIAGAATALYLARDGVRVSLVEAGVVGGGASGANAGSLHAQIPHDPFHNLGPVWATAFQPVVTLLTASLGLWRGLEADLGTDLEIGFGGGIMVGATPLEMAEIAAKAEIERAAGLDVQLLDRDTLYARAPYLGPGAVGGAFCAIEGKANPMRVAPAYAAAARAAGVEIIAGHGKAMIARSGAGYVVSIGNRSLCADRLVIAAGGATGGLAAQLGAHLAITSTPIQVCVTEPAAPFVPHLVYCAGEKLSLKQSRVGSILIGGGWDAVLDDKGRPVVNADNLAANLRVAMRIVPGIGGLTLVRSWAALVNGTDDWLPIIGELPGAPGAFINYVPWLGFSGGPAAARLTADLVLGRLQSLDVPMASFAPNPVQP